MAEVERVKNGLSTDEPVYPRARPQGSRRATHAPGEVVASRRRRRGSGRTTGLLLCRGGRDGKQRGRPVPRTELESRGHLGALKLPLPTPLPTPRPLTVSLHGGWRQASLLLAGGTSAAWHPSLSHWRHPRQPTPLVTGLQCSQAELTGWPKMGSREAPSNGQCPYGQVSDLELTPRTPKRGAHKAHWEPGLERWGTTQHVGLGGRAYSR